MDCNIEKIVHPYAWELLQSRVDESIITGQPMTERPFWYRNKSTGQLYYSLYGCIGFPSELTSTSAEEPGYIAVIGVVKPQKEGDKPIQNANFQMLAEYESKFVHLLLEQLLIMRQEWGFGLHPELLHTWFGDFERYIPQLARLNETLIEKGGETQTVLVGPFDDFENPRRFDEYWRDLQSVLNKEKQRLFFGGCDVLKTKLLRSFNRDNPAVLAMGGMVHSLMARTLWMDHTRTNCFTLDEDSLKSE